MKKFVLPKNAPSNVINGHVFQDGILIVSDEDAKKLEKIFCRYYGIRMESVEESAKDADSSNSNEPSLAKDFTKPSTPQK